MEWSYRIMLLTSYVTILKFLRFIYTNSQYNLDNDPSTFEIQRFDFNSSRHWFVPSKKIIIDPTDHRKDLTEESNHDYSIPYRYSTLHKEKKDDFLSMKQGHDNHDKRRLGEFDHLNTMLDGMVLLLPNIRAQEDLGIVLGSIAYEIKNLKCYHFSVGDIQISHEILSNKKIAYFIQITGITMDCDFDWSHNYASVGGEGAASIKTKDNSVFTSIIAISDNYQFFPPNKAKYDSCTVAMQISEMDFNGGLSGLISESFSGMFANGMEKSMQNTICQNMETFASFLDEIILKMSSKVESLHGEILKQDADPLFGESSLIVPTDMNLLDWTNTDDPISNGFILFLINSLIYFGTIRQDIKNPTIPDLGINIFLRDRILDENGLIKKTISELGMLSEGILYSNTGSLAATTVKLLEFHVEGIDSITSLEEAHFISARTFQTNATWDAIRLEIKLIVDMSPSVVDNSISEESNFVPKFEFVTIKLRIIDLIVRFTFLAAMDRDKLFDIQISSILQEGQFYPCMLSSYVVINTTQVEFIEGILEEPIIQGFTDEGFDRILSDSATAFHTMYYNSILKASPNFFATTIKPQVNDIIQQYLDDPSQMNCPKYEKSISTPIDFRDLFLEKEMAINAGGSGTAPYGDKSSQMKLNLDMRFQKVDAINNIIIEPITTAQSGEAGTIQFPGEFQNFASNNMRIKMYDLRMDHLDSFGIPKEFFTVGKSPYLMRNSIAIGASTPMHASSKLEVTFGNSGMQETKNVIKIDLGVNEADIFFTIFMHMEESALLKFPVGDVTNINCWFATAPAPTLNHLGIRTQDSDPSIILGDFLFTYVKNIDLDIDCISCISSGIVELPNMLKLLKSAGIIRQIFAKLLIFIEEILTSEYIQTHLDRFIVKAKRFCPHSKLFNSTIVEYIPPPLPQLSPESTEFVILATGINVQIALLVIVINYDANNADMNSFSGERALASLNIPSDKVIDLSQFEESFGKILNNKLQSIEQDPNVPGRNDLYINHLIRSMILNNTDSLIIQPSDLSISLALGINFELSAIRIYGLDKCSSLNTYDPIDAHTIDSYIMLQNITIELEFKVEDQGDIIMSIEMIDVSVTLTFMLALDKDKTGNVQLGSLLDTSLALQCILSNTIIADVTKVLIKPERIRETIIKGTLSDDAKAILATSADSILTAYYATLMSALQHGVRNKLNADLEEYIIQSDVIGCTQTDRVSKFIDFRDLLLEPKDALDAGGLGTMPYGDLFFLINNILRSNLLSPNESGSPKISEEAIRPYIEENADDGGRIFLPGNVYTVRLENGSRVRVNNIYIQNLDSIGYPLQFLVPRNNHADIIDNEITFGVHRNILRIWAKIFVDVNENEATVLNEINFRVDLNAASFFLSIFAKLDEQMFKKLPLRHFNDIDCWIATIPPPDRTENAYPTLSVETFTMLSRDVEVMSDCVSCPSSEIEDMITLTMLLNNPISLGKFAENFVNGPLVQEKIEAIQDESTLNCGVRNKNDEAILFNPYAQQSDYTDDTYKAAVGFLASGSLVILIWFCISSGIKYVTLKNHRKWLSSLAEEDVFNIYRDQMDSDRTTKILSDRSGSMISNAPRLLRVLLPAIVILNIYLLYISHFNLSAFFEMSGHLSEEKFEISTVYKFSVSSFTVDLWRAESKVMAATIFGITLLFSYAKQLLILSLWCVPASKLSIEKRDCILRWLEKWTKWSLLGIYVILMYIVSIRISISSPTDLPFDYYEIEMKVIPLSWGFLAGVLAQIVSHLSSHISIYYHDKSVLQTKNVMQKDLRQKETVKHDPASNDVDPVGLDERDLSENVCGHFFKLRSFELDQTVQVKGFVNWLILVLTFLAMFLLIAGSALPSVKIEIHGILGFIYEASNNFNDAKVHHSILSIARLIAKEVIEMSSPALIAGMVSITTLVLISTIIVPYLLTTILLCIWFLPMRQKRRNQMMRTVSILKSWKYLEVYILSLILVSWQLDGISSWLPEYDYCTPLRKVFATLIYYNVKSDKHLNRCLDNKVFVGHAVLPLIFSYAILAFLTDIITKAAAQKQRDDEGAQLVLKERRWIPIDEVNSETIIDLIKLNPSTQFTDNFRVLLKKNTSFPAISPISPSQKIPRDNEERSIEKEADLFRVQQIDIPAPLPSWSSSWTESEKGEEMDSNGGEYFF